MEQQIKELVASQRAFFRTRRTRPLDFRLEKLRTLRSAIVDAQDQLVEAMRKDLGRSPKITVDVEIARTLRELDLAIDNLADWMKPTEFKDHKAGDVKIVREPYGTCLVIGAFNFPFALTLDPAISALAAGNTVVVKPSELAIHTAQVIADIIEASFEPAYFACVQGEVEVAQALTAQRWDSICYTGSPRVGKLIMAAIFHELRAARHLTPIVLELGGKNPLIVAPDADVDRVAESLVRGKFLNAGQVCLMTDYVILTSDGLVDRFARALKTQLESAFGERAQKAPHFGRIINETHFDRLQDLINKTSGRLLYKSADANDRVDRYIAPHVFAVNQDDVLMEDEIFGPILAVIQVDGIDAAIDYVNSKDKPLACYVFSKNPDTTRRVVEETSSGGVTANATLIHATLNELPFGGVGCSGTGRLHGRFGFSSFTHEKPVVVAKI